MKSLLIALLTINSAHLHYNKIQHVCGSISGYFVVLARNCLSSTLDCVIMQMRKTNLEKGYIYWQPAQQAFPKTYAKGTKLFSPPPPPSCSPPLLPDFLLIQACSFARPLFHSLVRSPHRKGKESSATQATILEVNALAEPTLATRKSSGKPTKSGTVTKQ